VPSSYRGSFSALPNDILLLICSMLRSPELCTLGLVSRRLADLSSRNQSWALRCGFMDYPETQVPWVHAMLLAEASLKARWMRYRSWKIRRAEGEYRAAIRDFSLRRRMCVLHTLDGPCFCIVVGVLLVLGVALCSRRAESSGPRGDGGGLGFTSTWPFLMLVAFAVLVTGLVCLARCDRGRGVCCHGEAYALTHPGGRVESNGGVIRSFATDVLADNGAQLGLSCIVFLAVMLFFLGLALKFTGGAGAVEGLSYPAVFAPAFVAFGVLACLCIHPVMRGLSPRQRLSNCLSAWCALLGPLLVFLVLLCVRLSRGDLLGLRGGGGGLPWMVVVSPLLLLDLFVLVLAVLMAFDERSCLSILSYVCIIGPLVAFEVLFAYWMDGGGFGGPFKLALVFVPFWIFMCQRARAHTSSHRAGTGTSTSTSTSTSAPTGTGGL